MNDGFGAEEAIACRLVAHNAHKTSSQEPDTSSTVQPLIYDPIIINMLRQESRGVQDNASSISRTCPTRCCAKVFSDPISLDRHIKSCLKSVTNDHDNIPDKSSDHHGKLSQMELVTQEVNGRHSSDHLDQTIDMVIKREINSSDECISDTNTEDVNQDVYRRLGTSKSNSKPKSMPLKYNKRDNSVVRPISEGRTQLEPQLKQAIVNLHHFFREKNPDWKEMRVMQEVADGMKVSLRSVKDTVYYSRKYGTIRERKKTRQTRGSRYVCSDDDRTVIERCIYKMKNENRLKSVRELYNEIECSQEFNPSFKGCGRSTFHRIFQKSGFRITETMIINRKPSAAQTEGSKVDGMWQCSWPGCDKRFKDRQHLLSHTRTHTQEKPFECRQPGCDYRCTQYGNFLKHLKVHNITVTKNITFEKNDNVQ